MFVNVSSTPNTIKMSVVHNTMSAVLSLITLYVLIQHTVYIESIKYRRYR